MRKIKIIFGIIIMFVLGCCLGVYIDIVTSVSCKLNVTSTWKSYVGVSGKEFNGGERIHKFKSIKSGDFIDYSYKKNNNKENIYIEVLDVKDNYVVVNVLKGKDKIKDNEKVKYNKSFSVDLGSADDGPHIIDEIVFKK